MHLDALVEGDWEVGLHKRSVVKAHSWQKRPDKPLLIIKLKKRGGIKELREIKSQIHSLIDKLVIQFAVGMIVGVELCCTIKSR